MYRAVIASVHIDHHIVVLVFVFVVCGILDSSLVGLTGQVCCL